MATEKTDPHERSAGGLDFDEADFHGKASALGSKLLDEGPQAVLDEIENLLPEAWREQITAFPVAAMVLGVGVGVWLGAKKSHEIITAGGALVSAAAMANVAQVMDKVK